MFGSHNLGPGRSRTGRWLIAESGIAVTRHGGSLLRSERMVPAETLREPREWTLAPDLPDLTDTASGSVRREWLQGCLALTGMVIGWFAPLLVKWFAPAAGATLYEHAEGVLCPLLACFGGGMGLVCAEMWKTVERRPAFLPRFRESKAF